MSFRIAIIVVVAMGVICMMTFNFPSLTGDTPDPEPETPEPTAPVEPTTAGSAEPSGRARRSSRTPGGATEPRVRIRSWLPPGSDVDESTTAALRILFDSGPFGDA